ncbi:MAG TPA: amino acid adenylation domain-containing protein, partial [Thermoanaerobaculia bacterium]|nr:amino acid adenylation domain-containing protein [Thermoanaerobaculia bacterium]
ANRLAHALRRRGVGPEVPVAVLMERALELPVALLGILKAGGAYVPLDPAYPPERLAQMVADALPHGGPAVLLAQERWAGLLPAASGLQPIFLDSHRSWTAAGLAAEPATRPDSRAGAGLDHLAYVIFTSGSTGRPKGSMNSHRAVVNRLLLMRDLTADDRVLQKTPYTFDVSVWELFWPLLSGARLVIARPGGHQDGAYLVRTLAIAGITTVHFVPSMLQAFLETPGVAGSTSLRRVLASGEALPAPLVERLFARLPTVTFHNLYGPTEAAIEVTAWTCQPGSREAAVPIGRPVANARIHLLDARLQPVPPGVHGELYIGGRPVGRGYRGRPELTAERFVPDPLGEAGTRLYRTGDLARHRHDGAIEFLGRADSQVKLRGLRIELGEIEGALRQQAGVREAAVLALADLAGDRLVAWVAGEGLSAAALRTGLARQLPAFMIPAAFVTLPALPLTASGKLDRRALPAPEWQGEEDGYVAPRDPLESLVAGIWADLLGVPRVGAQDGFFALGGHSLLATRAISRLNEALGVELPLRTLFEHPTPAAFARAAGAARRADRLPPPPLRRLPRDRPLSPSFAQERLWVMDQLLPGNPVYNVFQAIRLTGPLDLAALEGSFAAVVSRHETLRTRFTTVQGRPFQVIEPASPGVVPGAASRVDLTGLPDAAREGEAARLAPQEARRPFHLKQGPLFRLSLLLLDGATRVLLLSIHHIVCDDWSLGLLVDQVAALYRGVVGRSAGGIADRPVALPELPFQYADYAAWQREWLTGEVLEAELAHWRGRLA